MAEPRYAVELKSGLNAAQFNAGGEEIELTAEKPRFETSEAALYLGARDLPFVKDLGEIKAKGGAE